MIPATALISIFLFGIEELATSMEEPFTILPMQAFCDKIGNWCNEIVSWEAGDNGMPVNPVLEKYTKFDDEMMADQNYEASRKSRNFLNIPR